MGGPLVGWLDPTRSGRPPPTGAPAYPRRPASTPFAAQHGVDAQGGPRALEPVGLDHARLAAEAEALEDPLHGAVAVVGAREDPVNAVVLEQARHHAGERLAGQPAALMARRQRDAHLGRRRL